MLKRDMRIGQRRRDFAVFLSWTFALAIGLTLFYYVHEQLPRFVRAPSSLILAPVAIVDGLCYAANLPGIYGKALPIFIVNCVFAALLCAFACLAQSVWRRRNI